MRTLPAIGLATLLGISCREEPNLGRNPQINPRSYCKIESFDFHGGSRKEMFALDTDGDRHIDEVFVTIGYHVNMLSDVRFEPTRTATIHYTREGLPPQEQMFSAFPNNAVLPKEYELILETICRR